MNWKIVRSIIPLIVLVILGFILRASAENRRMQADFDLIESED